MLKSKKFYLIPVIGILAIVLIGAILLSLPICTKEKVSFFEALFLSVSAICLNGYTLIDILTKYNFLGQLILVAIVQLGALGIMLIFSILFHMHNRKMNFAEKVVLGNILNSNDYSEIRNYMKKILKYTFVIEAICAVFLAIRFIPLLGLAKGLWYSVFHSITAFCNAGFSLFGPDSLVYFRFDNYINILVIIEMFLGGIGFFVIDDIVRCFKMRNFKKLRLNSKIVIYSSLICVFVANIFLHLLQPGLNIIEGIFTIGTLRTTGFSIMDMNKFTAAAKVLFMIVMFIGGAPGSTSGGVRITSIALFFSSTKAILKGEHEIVIGSNRVDHEAVRRSIAIVTLASVVICSGVILFAKFNDNGLETNVLHTLSSFSAVGLSFVAPENLNLVGRWITIALMLIGRMGPISLSTLFILGKKKNSEYQYPVGNIII